MPQTFDHLHTGVWSFLDESLENRITRLYLPKWVSYEGASEALARMEHRLRHPPCGRMPSMLLYSDSDIGKTMMHCSGGVLRCPGIGRARLPGGAPGLQNRWDAPSVSGGFDSHALPPALPLRAPHTDHDDAASAAMA